MFHQVALRYTNQYSADKVRVLTLVRNRGKGGAVRMVRLDCRKFFFSSSSWSNWVGSILITNDWISLLLLKGTLSSRGKLILMADADGATKFSDIEKVETGLKDLNSGPVGFLFSFTVSYKCAVLWKSFKPPVFCKIITYFDINSSPGFLSFHNVFEVLLFIFIIQCMLKKRWRWTSKGQYMFQP